MCVGMSDLLASDSCNMTLHTSSIRAPIVVWVNVFSFRALQYYRYCCTIAGFCPHQLLLTCCCYFILTHTHSFCSVPVTPHSMHTPHCHTLSLSQRTLHLLQIVSAEHSFKVTELSCYEVHQMSSRGRWLSWQNRYYSFVHKPSFGWVHSNSVSNAPTQTHTSTHTPTVYTYV